MVLIGQGRKMALQQVRGDIQRWWLGDILPGQHILQYLINLAVADAEIQRSGIVIIKVAAIQARFATVYLGSGAVVVA